MTAVRTLAPIVSVIALLMLAQGIISAIRCENPRKFSYNASRGHTGALQGNAVTVLTGRFCAYAYCLQLTNR